MGQADYLKIGSWNCICDRCGFKYKAEELKQEWTGLLVCGDCWEPRHEQDFVRARPDQKPLPFTSPESPDTFISVTYSSSLPTSCSAMGIYSQAGYAEAGCAIAGLINGNLIT